MTRRICALSLGALAALTSYGATAGAASVVSPTGKGITGCALLGSEAVMLTEAVIGVRPWWAYAIGGGVGAIGGGIGGYYIEQTGEPKLPFYLFMGGMALALPTTIAVLSATAYKPVNYTEDKPPDEPIADPAAPVAPPSAGSTSDRTAPARPKRVRVVTRHRTKPAEVALPPALVDIRAGGLQLAVPAVEVRQVYTRTEIVTLGVKQAAEVRIPVLNVVF